MNISEKFKLGLMGLGLLTGLETAIFLKAGDYENWGKYYSEKTKQELKVSENLYIKAIDESVLKHYKESQDLKSISEMHRDIANYYNERSIKFIENAQDVKRFSITENVKLFYKSYIHKYN